MTRGSRPPRPSRRRSSGRGVTPLAYPTTQALELGERRLAERVLEESPCGSRSRPRGVLQYAGSGVNEPFVTGPPVRMVLF